MDKRKSENYIPVGINAGGIIKLTAYLQILHHISRNKQVCFKRISAGKLCGQIAFLSVALLSENLLYANGEEEEICKETVLPISTFSFAYGMTSGNSVQGD